MEEWTKKVRIFLNNPHLFEHSLAVAKAAEHLATDGSVSAEKAFIAGLLHDIGGIYPNEMRVSKAEEFGLELLPEEREFPLIIHQKLSKFLAQQEFSVTDEEILDAIECHTTLRKDFTALDLIVFLADKIAWDGGEHAPFEQGLLTALSVSKAQAALFYIDFIMKKGLRVTHPWLLEGKQKLEKCIL